MQDWEVSYPSNSKPGIRSTTAKATDTQIMLLLPPLQSLTASRSDSCRMPKTAAVNDTEPSASWPNRSRPPFALTFKVHPAAQVHGGVHPALRAFDLASRPHRGMPANVLWQVVVVRSRQTRPARLLELHQGRHT